MPVPIPIECFDQDADLVDLIATEPSDILAVGVDIITFWTGNLP